METSAAPLEIAGVMPVTWNQSAPSNTVFQSTIPLSMVEMELPDRSYTTLLPRWTAPFSRK